MKLPGPQLQQLHAALLSAFATPSALEQMVRFHLDAQLYHIAGGGNLSDLVFHLLGWATAQGRLPALVEGACQANPGNPELQRFVDEVWVTICTATPPQPSPNEGGGREPVGEEASSVEDVGKKSTLLNEDTIPPLVWGRLGGGGSSEHAEGKTATLPQPSPATGGSRELVVEGASPVVNLDEQSTLLNELTVPPLTRGRLGGGSSSGRDADETFLYDVFLSHSSQDKDRVRELAERLRADRLRVWFDEWMIQPGDLIGHKIEAGIQQSRTLVLCLSPHALAAEWVTLERHTLLFRDPTNQARRFVPLLLADCDPPALLAQFAYIDWRTPMAAAYEKLLTTCRDEESKTETNQPSPQSPPEMSLTELHRTIHGAHIGRVWSVAYAPDGKTFLSGSHDKTVKLWDALSHTCIATFQGHIGEVSSVAYAPDGKTFLSGSHDKTVKLWDALSHTCIATFQGHTGGVSSVAYAPDGKTFLSGSYDKTVKLWDALSHTCIVTLQGHSNLVWSVAYAPDGKTFLSGSDDPAIKLWDAISHTCLATLQGHSGGVGCVAYAPDGKTFLSGSDDLTIKLWDAISHTCLATLQGHSGGVWSVAYAPDGKTFLSGSDDPAIKLWDAISHTCLATLQGHSGGVLSVAYAPDGKTFLSGSYDKMIKLWDMASHICIATLQGHIGAVRGIAYASDGRTFISSSDDPTIKLWDAVSYRCLATFEGHTAAVYSTTWSSDGETIVSGGADRTLKVWSVTKQLCVTTLIGHKEPIYCLIFSPNGQTLVSASHDHTLKLWSAVSYACLTTFIGHTDAVRSAAFAPDGQILVSASEDRTLKVWDPISFVCLTTLTGHTRRVESVAFAPDGKTFVSGSADRTLKVWDATSYTCLATLEGHTDDIWSIAFAPDSSVFVSASLDKTLRVWDAVTYTCLDTLKGHAQDIFCIAFAPDSQTFLSGYSDGAIEIWRYRDDPITASTTLTTRYTNAKVVLVGESGVGKSGLALRLAEDRWEETSSTHGMAVWPLALSKAKTADGLERELWLWDFAGQPDYRLVHQLYMGESALALLVIDPQSADPFAALAHWERALALALRNRPVVKLLVAARCDRGGLTISERRVADYCAAHGYAGFYKTAAKLDHDGGWRDLKAALVQHIPWAQLPFTATTQLFKSLQDTLLRLKEAGLVLARRVELRQRIQLLQSELVFGEAELRTVVGLLAGQGLLHELAFGDFVLLQPEQINNYASAVVRCAREHTDEIGCVLERAVLDGAIDFYDMPRLPAADEAILLRALVQTLVDRALCLREESPHGALLVFPAYFRQDRPEIIDQPRVLVSYRFAGPLDEIYTTLVVRLHYTDDFAKDQLWRDAADFRTHSGRRAGFQLRKLADDRADLQVYFDGDTLLDTQISFIKYVHEHLRKRGQEVSRVRNYRCPHCDEPLDKPRAQRRLEQGKADVRCDRCDQPFPLHDLIEEKFASDEFARTVHEMDAQAQFNLDRESLHLILVGHALAVATEAGQSFRVERNVELDADGVIDLRDNWGGATAQRLYLKLHLTPAPRDDLRGREEDIALELSPAQRRRWQASPHPVMLVYRTGNGQIRWLDLTDRQERDGTGEPFTALNLDRVRQRRLGLVPLT